jgi:protein-disulfide isomerase
VTLAVIAGVVVLVMAFKLVSSSSMKASQASSSGRMTGDPKARVKIVEFTDFQCPACAKASEAVNVLLNKPDAGVSLELKYFPLDMHRNARRAAVLAQCSSEQGKFWPMHHVLFRSQNSWGVMDDPDDYFLSLARSLGLDDAALMKCMAQPLAKTVIDQDIDEGKRRGVKATPTFFVNGKMAVGLSAFEKVLKESVQ